MIPIYHGGLVASRRNGRSQRPDPTATSVSVSPTPERPDVNFFDTVLRPEERRQQQSPLRLMCEMDVQGGVDILGFNGETTSDLEQRHLDLTSRYSDFQLPSTVASPSALSWTQSVEEAPVARDGSLDGVEANLPGSSPWSEPKATDEEQQQQQLLMRFLESEAPPTIFGSVNLEWKYVRNAIVNQSRDFRPLLNSIYCYADIHMPTREDKQWKTAPTYHQQASSEIRSHLLGDMSHCTLKRIFATVFLLMMSELISVPELCPPGASFLHSAYRLLQRFHRKTQKWTGFGHLIVSWVSLLDIKALIAGREGDPLIELGILSNSTREHIPGSDSTTNNNNNNNEDEEDEDTLAQPTYLIQTAILNPSFHFFFQTQQIIRRIVHIDLHHRSRGTVSDEFEVLQIAHQVDADLESLWNGRPRVLDLHRTPEALFDTLQPRVAVEVCRCFRQYIANFLAVFIYLHRVAFAIYPRTDRVRSAVDGIVQLARVEAESESLSLASGVSGVSSRALPIGFVWPLFVAGLEGSYDQRVWIIQTMQRMAMSDQQNQNRNKGHDSHPSRSRSHSSNVHDISAQRHPNVEKALFLLEEMMRRQDVSRTWADSRCVRREVFADFFVMI
ncbi:hypothetical protein EYZ11_010651 [Aspergillus tanneri]|uniref:Transcription factor domain-containing protein n=1 Tax=Aspergillus tanneri TaxID=1220188 RepID=A0A4S3J5B8_9EURO|nr:hypothetical protein EYZ11_010651 [Aspergillus tanneri]